MKIIIKNKKWHILFKNFCLICDVIWKNEEKRFYIRFELENKIILIKTRDIDKTLKNLENLNNIARFIFR